MSFGKSLFTAVFLCFGICFMGLGIGQEAWGADLDVTLSTALSAGEYTYDNVIVRSGVTLTVDGDTATNKGVVIHATNITVEANSFISADATGFGPGQGPGVSTGVGGAGYGGSGATVSSNVGSGTGGAPYGSAVTPEELGSGSLSAAGGGAVHLDATGTLTLDGTVSADGASAAGGGSGGSIWITAGTITGTGSIKANGGNGLNDMWDVGGGGSGGRIAVHYNVNGFAGTAQARGGYRPGEDGTVGFFDVSNPQQVKLNAGHSWHFLSEDSAFVLYDISLNGTTAFVEPGVDKLTAVNNIVIDAASSLSCRAAEGPIHLSAVNLALAAGGSILADAKGFPVNQSPGASTGNGGAGYGGRGGTVSGGAGGVLYGSAVTPVDMGSGTSSGAGGGAVRLEVTGTLTLDGTVSANGANGAGQDAAGAGSGGGIWINAGTITGTGTVRANGGDGYNDMWTAGGGGGGGRIAVYYLVNGFTGTAQVLGGTQSLPDRSGENGTVGFFDVSNPQQVRLYAGHSWRFLPIDAAFALYDIVLSGTAAVVEPGASKVIAANNFVIDAASTVSCRAGEGPLHLFAANNLTLAAGSSILADLKGYPLGQGPGTSTGNGGAGYGGRGGTVGGGPGGLPYGSAIAPADMGSASFSGAGGGAVHLEATGALTLNGTVSANGGNGTGQDAAGGAAGGGIWINAGTITGTGTVSADGGGSYNDMWTAGGGGGGGRIAVHYGVNGFTGTAHVAGGTKNLPDRAGEDGTIVWLREIPIALGQSLDITTEPFTGCLFRMDWPAAQDKMILIRVTPADNSGQWRLGGKYGTPGEDWTGVGPTRDDPPAYEMLVPVSQAGPYYYGVYYSNLAKSLPAFHIECVEAPARHICNVPLGSGSNSGGTTLHLTGTGLNDDARLELRTAAGVVLRSFTLSSADTRGATVRMNLAGLDPQTVNVAVVWPDSQEQVLAGALEITGANPGTLETKIEIPSYVRVLRPATLWVEYANTGGCDLPAPLLAVTSASNLAMRLSPADAYERGPVLLLGINDRQPASVLPPGARRRVPVQFIAEGGPHEKLDFDLVQLRDDATPTDWAALKDKAAPPAMPADAWDVIWAHFSEQAGSTTSALIDRLRQNADYLADSGNSTLDASRLLQLEFTSADASVGVTEPQIATVDASAWPLGCGLSFERYLTDGIESHFDRGPLGPGWKHNFQFSLTFPAPDVALLKTPGAVPYRIEKSPTGEWQAGRKAACTFEEIGDGAFRLTLKGSEIWTFDASGLPVSVADTNGNAITLGYSGGNLTTLQHSDGQTFTLAYDALGRITELTDDVNRKTRYAYSDETLASVTEPDGAVTSYACEGAGAACKYAVTAITYPDGSSIHMSYDTYGRCSGWMLDGGLEPVTVSYPSLALKAGQNALGAVGTMGFDGANSLLAAVNPFGDTTSLQYNDYGSMTRMINPDGAQSEITYDILGAPHRFVDRGGNASLFGFDGLYNLLGWIQDANGNRTTSKRDAKGNVTQIVYANGSVLQIAYDTKGRVIQATNRRGKTVTFTRDTLGAVTGKAVDGGGTDVVAYDAKHRPVAVSDPADPTRDVSVAYDANNDLVTHVGYAGGHTLDFTYDIAGSRTQSAGDGGFGLNYVYDTVGRLSEVRSAAGDLFVEYERNAAGSLTRETRGNGVYTTYEYDSTGCQVVRIMHYSAAAEPLAGFAYSYDVNGRVVSVAELDGKTTEYVYDAVGNLSHVAYPNGSHEDYQYDALGNRVSVTTEGGATAYASNGMNQYFSVGSELRTYDPDGNLTAVGGDISYTFDTENQLVGASTPEGSMTYGYNALGQRTLATHNAAATRYVCDPQGLGNIVAEYDGDNNLVARYVYANTLLARIDASGNAVYYGFDGTGNTRLLTNGSGQVVGTYDYSAFGLPRGATGSTPNPFQFGGAMGVTREPNGLLYMRARYYDPSTGRFISEDPMGSAGGINLYTYAGNDPINATDPSGLDAYDTLRDAAIDKGKEEVGKGIIERIYDKTFGRAFDYANECLYEGGRGTATHGGKDREVRDVTRGVYEFGRKKQRLDEMTDAVKKEGRVLVSNGPTGYVKEKLKDSAKEAVTGSWAKRKEGMVTSAQNLGKAFKLCWTELRIWWTSRGHGSTENITPGDPNEKIGPAGYGVARLVSGKDEMFYAVYFENKPTASAPAQEVIVSDNLDAGLDKTTLALSEVAWGDTVIAVPDGALPYSERMTIPDYRAGESRTWFLDIDAGFDPASGALQWSFRTIDPDTEDLPEDALAGFLPPNDDSHRGEGRVSFRIKPRTDAADGTVVKNKASIVFDTQAAMETNEVSNTLGTLQKPAADFTADPLSGVAPLFVQFTDQSDARTAPITNREWVFGDGGTSTDTNPAHVYTIPGTYAVTLTVTTEIGSDSVIKTGLVSVAQPNRAPILDPIGAKQVNEGQQLQFTVTASDPDHDTVTLSADNLPDGATFAPATGVFTWTPGAGTENAYENVVFTATDNGTPPLNDSENITITVIHADVPSVTGMMQTAAQAAITGAGLTVGVVTEAYSATVAAGVVISQDPVSGARVAPGAAVNIVVSKGPQPVSVLNLAGMTRAGAEAAIAGAGLTVGTVTEAYSATVAAGMVISQEPLAGTNVLLGAAVNFAVSNGPQPVDVPNVVGMTQTAAQSAIAGAGLTVGVVTEAYSTTVAVGAVISQDPASGAGVVPGSAVSFVLSKGPEPVSATVPDLAGKVQSAAEAAITAAGLTVGGVTEDFSNEVPKGQVMSQTPAAGTAAAPGSAVSFVVSKGKKKTGIFGCSGGVSDDASSSGKRGDILVLLLTAGALAAVTRRRNPVQS